MRFPFFSGDKNSHRSTAYGRKARFEQAIGLARRIVTIDPAGLSTLVQLVAAPLQARTITSVVYAGPHGAREADNFNTLFFDATLPLTADQKCAYELAPLSDQPCFKVHLGNP